MNINETRAKLSVFRAEYFIELGSLAVKLILSIHIWLGIIWNKMDRILNDVVMNFHEHPGPDVMRMNRNITTESNFTCKDKNYTSGETNEILARALNIFHFCCACQTRGGKIHFSHFLSLAAYLIVIDHNLLIRVFVRKHLYENVSPKGSFSCKSNSSSYPVKGIVRGLILKQRHMVIRKWPTNKCARF